MKYIFVILAIVALAFAQKEKMRLIEMNGHRFWVHQDQIPNLQPKEGELVNFMDVTNTQNLETSGKVEEVVLPDKPTQQETVKPMMEKIEEHSESHLNSVVGHLQTYRTRGANTDTGVQAVQWMKAEYQKRLDSIPEDRRSLFTVEYVNHTRWRQPSLIVKMKGKASNDQIVILGSHIDSTASGGVAPGADDDASGSASVLEAFTILAKYSNFTPSKSIEWHHYAAEEMGLLGSREIAQAYKARNAKVYAMMQLDMTGYNPRSTNKIGVITNGVDPALTAFSRKLITEYGKIGFIDRTLFGGTSDHASWRSAGYKACFPFEAVTNPNIHTARDTLSQLDMKNGIEWVKLAVSYMVELSHN